MPRRMGPLSTLPLTIVLISFGAVLGASARPDAGVGARYRSERDLLEVMFARDSRVRLRGNDLVDLAGTNATQGVGAALAKLGRHEWSRLCDVPEDKLDELQRRGKLHSGVDVYNLNNIYRLRFAAGTSGVDAWQLGRELEALPGVLSARPVPLPAPAPLPPDFQPGQNYEDPATSIPTGIDAEYAWTRAGGNGTVVTVCDIEYSWNYGHNDVTKALGSQINANVADPFNDNNHGTAVLGELVSDDNGPNWGTKGACFGSNLKTCGSYYGLPSPSWNVPGAIAVAMASLVPGDVILLEQQWDYTGGGGYVPVEWWTDTAPNPQSFNAVYAAIQNAVSLGVNVVEAGGNGGMDTDGLVWQPDDGAIIVGAGGAYPGGLWSEGNLERLSFSSYGSRYNLQGWGEDVVTTGYGDLFSGEGVNRWYTQRFSGTSSASPIVASAAACLEGYFLANVAPVPLSPSLVRGVLMTTGTPQVFGPPGSIGPRPDLRAAIQAVSPQTLADYGDAPEGAIAYPSLGVVGSFPTCTAVGPPGSFVRHAGSLSGYFGGSIDLETDGNAGNCAFPPYDADECSGDADAGLMRPTSYTIDAGLNVVPCAVSLQYLGGPCSVATWGANLDIFVNNTSAGKYVNVLVDWNEDGAWSGTSPCGFGSVPEHVLVNFPVPALFSGPLSVLLPPGFVIGPRTGYVWARFTISEVPVPVDWNGAGTFDDGETEDYLLLVGSSSTGFDESAESSGPTALVSVEPNPFRFQASIRAQLSRRGPVSVGIFDVVGRRVRTLFDGNHAEGACSFTWDGRDASGRRAAAGVYFVRMQADGKTLTERIVRMR
ncbi:MAG: FlgD immunoglobulin-like domain containing protein [bacterium]